PSRVFCNEGAGPMPRDRKLFIVHCPLSIVHWLWGALAMRTNGKWIMRNGQWIMAFLVVLYAPAFAYGADPSFPRGPGFYFSIPKLLLIFLFYLVWISTVWWANKDALALKLPTDTWNSLIFGCGVLGFVILWLLPWFWISFPVLLVLYLTASLAYVNVRNQHVTSADKVLTERHIKELLERFLKLRFRSKEDEDAGAGPNIVFFGRSFNQQDDDQTRVTRAAGSRGYKAAKEMVYEAIQRRATDIHL